MHDILMITYNRAYYTKLALGRLLETCDDHMRVWVWQNGSDPATMEVVESFRRHPRFFQYRHSPENKKLNEPTNWLWQNSEADYLSKVDDDCLVPHGWGETLRQAHRDVPEFGVIGCWHFFEDDFVPELAEKKIKTFPGGHRLMRNCWLGGSGYVMKRECFDALGPLSDADKGFTDYGMRLAQRGYFNGWYYPFLYQEHMDDPRSPHTLLKTDDDILQYRPLSAQKNGVTTVAAWQAHLIRSARQLQSCSFDPKYYTGWRRQVRRLSLRKLYKVIRGDKRQW